MSATWAIEALIASTLLMGCVLLVRKSAQRAFGPQLAYWLWALPALRMVMPPLPAAWRESVAAPVAAASETVLVYIAPTAATAADPVAAPLPWLLLIAGAWVVGATAFFAWHGAAHFAYVRRIVRPPARHARLADGTTLVESEEAIGPVAFGVLKRFVAVPRDFAERYDADERRLALAHELGHHARGDLIANWIALALLAVHWFNPLAWIAYRKFRTDQELANDARVLGRLPPVERHAYACAILKAANGRAITAACHLHTIEDLKGRLRMLKATRKSRRVLLAGATGIMALTVAGLGLTASGAAAEQLRERAAVQVPLLAVQAAPMTPPAIPATEPTPPAPPAPMTRHKKVVIVKDGKTQTYEGADADAYLAANPAIAAHTDGNVVRRNRLVIRGKDGKTQTYEGDAATAYMKAHPEMAPPVPPLLPVGGFGARAPMPPMPPMVSVFTTADGKKVKRMTRVAPNGRAYAYAYGPEVVEGDCGNRDPGGFVVHDKTKDGKPRMVICKVRIERFAADQGRFGKLHALEGLRAGREAIVGSAGLTPEQRAQALAGIDQARAAIEAEMKDSGKADK